MEEIAAPGLTDRRKQVFPYLLIFAIFSISIAILHVGWSAISGQKQQRAALQREDEARQVLGALVYGSNINPYLTRISAFLTTRLQKPLAESRKPRFDPHQKFLQPSFPEHEIWAFSYDDRSDKSDKNGRSANNTAQACLYPANSSVGRRGMANAFAAIDAGASNAGNDKLVDFLFGPGLTIKDLALRKGQPTRVIYRNRHHLLVWNTISLENTKAGGFFLIVPDSLPLQRFAMTTSSRSATTGKFFTKNSASTRCYAGYMRIFQADTGSIYPQEIDKIPELASFLHDWQHPPNLAEMERNPLPWGKKFGEWELYTHSIPNSSHLAFVLLQPQKKDANAPLPVTCGNILLVMFALLILAAYSGVIPFPALKLQTRFTLFFICLAAIPFSLVFIAANMYLEELRITLISETRQKLHKSLSSFDQNVEDVYLFFRSELQKLHQQPWLQANLNQVGMPEPELIEKTKDFLQKLSPPLPWGALLFVNHDGKTVQAFRSKSHQTALDGFTKFDRIGLIDAMRKSKGMTDIATASASSFISDSDLALKQAFETLVRLPVCHGFVNKSIGQPTQVAFGSLSIMRIFDFFPSVQDQKVAFAVAWLEDELDRLFCSEAIKKLKREYPGLRFEIFRKEHDKLKRIARTHKQSNLLNSAFSASLRNGFSFSLSPRTQSMEIAFASQRRPGIILAGAIDTGFIDEKLNTLAHSFFWLSIFGLLAILYFQKFLSGRLIVPFLLLQKSLANVQNGCLLKLPQVRRRDEIWQIFTAFNEMLDGLKARQRLLSLVSGKALQVVGNKPGSVDADAAKAVPVVAMVSDIRDFTTLCGQYAPDVITRLLNLHFDRMSQIIYAHGGEISRFVGDAIEASFPCPADQKAEVIKGAVEASLTMLESISLINEERERQGLFSYRIGIGLSHGMSHIFHVGGNGGRREVLQVGEPLKKAGELEAFSKEFSGCPLIMDTSIGAKLAKMPEYSGKIHNQNVGSEVLFFFPELPGLQHQLTEASESNSHAEKAENREFAKASEKVQAARTRLFPGLAIVLLPFLLGIFGVFYGYNRYHDGLIQDAHARNQYAMECEKIPLAKKEMIEIQLQKTLSELSEHSETADSLHSPFDGDPQNKWQQRVDAELRAFGLIPEEIIFSPFAEAKPQNPSYKALMHPAAATRTGRLKDILHECLRCYGMQYDRFLQPDEKKLLYLGESMNGILLTRDTRARFATVAIASETFWIYWQPVLNLPWARDAKNNKFLGGSADISDAMRLYGRFSESDYSSLILGGVLILCRPPVSISDLRQKPENSSTLSAHIDLNSMTIDEERGNLDSLINDFTGIQTQIASRAAKLLSVAYQVDKDNAKWAIDHILVPGPTPKVHIFATRPSAVDGSLKPLKTAGFAFIIVIMILMIITGFLWYQATQDRGITDSVNGQILGSFVGIMLLPVAGLFIVLTLLASDWKNNLLKESETGFLQQVDMIEQQVRLHHHSNPQKVRKILEIGNINRFFGHPPTETRPDEKQVNAGPELKSFLQNVYHKLMRTSQALGVTMLMVDSSAGGLSDFLRLDGEFAAENDPMKKTFSFHAGRVIQRLNGAKGIAKNIPEQTKDANSLIVDEMTAQLVFGVLNSTFGSDATLELLFGQGRGIELFSSISNDVFFQEFFPGIDNPLGIVFTLFSHLHSNQFALARILAARHFQHAMRDPLAFEIFAASKLSPGMPLTPETGATKPFIAEIARQSMLTGHLEKSLTYNGEEYYVSTHHSIVLPQFVFIGVVKKSLFSDHVRNRIAGFVATLLLFFSLLMMLSMYSARDITRPLSELLRGLSRVKTGDYHCQLSFGREDELEEIARAFTGMARQLSEKDLLVCMVSESAAEMAHSDQAESEALQGRRRTAAVAYFGIPQFDRFLKNRSFEQIKTKLTSWVANVCATVTAHGGEVDKIMEGKILTVFFADKASTTGSSDTSNHEHLTNACRAAIKICSQVSPGLPHTSCGIHVGDVISGLMGNQERRDFTIIGDPVNLAARCFSLAENLPEKSGVIATEETVAMLHESFATIDLGTRRIKGKPEPVRLFRLQA